MKNSFSAKITLGKPQKNGHCQVYLQVIISRKPKFIPLDISWPLDKFDAENGGHCLKREKGKADPEAEENNRLIKKKLGRANEVAGNHRWNGQLLTMGVFLEEFNTEASSTDFIAYYEAKMKSRRRKKQISANTLKNQTNSLNKLKAFRKELPFYKLNYEFAEDFTSFLKENIKPRRGNEVSKNTIWGHHKDVLAYLSFARKDKIRFEDPYEDYSNKGEESHWMPLHHTQLRKFEDYYTLLEPRTTERRILAKFLFSCHSGMRLGDLSRVHLAEWDGDTIIYKPRKTYLKTGKKHRLPLTKMALQYLEDARREEGSAGFFNYADQTGNKKLKKIAEKLEITDIEMHWHVGRETFGTDFIRKGGDVAVLQKLMDHFDIKTTMKYVKIHEDLKKLQVSKMNEVDALERAQKKALPLVEGL